MASTGIGSTKGFIAAFVLIVIVLGGVYGIIKYTAPSGGSNTTVINGSTVTQVQTGQGSGYQLWVNVQDAFDGSDLTYPGSVSAKVDIISPTDFTKVIETVTWASAAAKASGNYYQSGTQLVFHVSSQHDTTTYGSETYDEWYLITLGGASYQLRPPETPTQTSSYSLDQLTRVPLSNSFVGQTSSSGNYWVLPVLHLYHRVVGTYMSANIQNSDGSMAMASAWAGSASTFDAQASQTNKFTQTTGIKSISFTLQVTVKNSKLVWGRPMLVLSPQQPYPFLALYPAMWVAFNTTSLHYTTAGGIAPISLSVTGWTVLYAGMPSQDGIGAAYNGISSSKGLSLNIPATSFDTSSISAATKLAVAVYMGDCQYMPDVASGTASGTPAGYGAIASSGVGPQAVVGTTFSIAASAGINAGTNVPSRSTTVYEVITTG